MFVSSQLGGTRTENGERGDSLRSTIMIQPAHLRKNTKMAGIGIFSVDEHAEGVSVDLGVRCLCRIEP